MDHTITLLMHLESFAHAINYIIDYSVNKKIVVLNILIRAIQWHVFPSDKGPSSPKLMLYFAKSI